MQCVLLCESDRILNAVAVVSLIFLSNAYLMQRGTAIQKIFYRYWMIEHVLWTLLFNTTSWGKNVIWRIEHSNQEAMG